MIDFDINNPAVFFGVIFGFIILLTLPSSSRSILLLIILCILYVWYRDNRLPQDLTLDSENTSNEKFKYLRSDTHYRKIITQCRSLRKYNIPVYDSIMYKLNRLIKIKKVYTIGRYSYEYISNLANSILNDTASLLLSIPPGKTKSESLLSDLQNQLRLLIDFDIKKMFQGKPELLNMYASNDNATNDYSNNFNLY
jgi:hypothetical protein